MNKMAKGKGEMEGMGTMMGKMDKGEKMQSMPDMMKAMMGAKKDGAIPKEAKRTHR